MPAAGLGPFQLADVRRSLGVGRVSLVALGAEAAEVAALPPSGRAQQSAPLQFQKHHHCGAG